MHRSGTSALAGALGALGFNQVRPGDRVEWSQSNPEHWESLSLGLFDEGLLHRLGGSWDAPPDLPRHWVHSASILGGGEAVATMAEAFPQPGPSVWKDPRLCLLLPYWRTLLPEPPAAVFVWRNPLAVAHSLYRRDGMPLAVGLALWERYNRAALESLAGLDTFGVDFDHAVADPTGFVERCAAWLGALDQFDQASGRWDLDQAATSIASDLKHQPARFPAADEALVTAEQRQLLGCLQGATGVHHPLRQGPPPVESAWTTAIIDTRRATALQRTATEAANQRFWATRARLASTLVELRAVEQDLYDNRRAVDDLRRARNLLRDRLERAEQDLVNLQASTSWKVTGPLRSVAARMENRGQKPVPS
jgi:hypothetical protein